MLLSAAYTDIVVHMLPIYSQKMSPIPDTFSSPEGRLWVADSAPSLLAHSELTRAQLRVETQLISGGSPTAGSRVRAEQRSPARSGAAPALPQAPFLTFPQGWLLSRSRGGRSSKALWTSVTLMWVADKCDRWFHFKNHFNPVRRDAAVVADLWSQKTKCYSASDREWLTFHCPWDKKTVFTMEKSPRNSSPSTPCSKESSDSTFSFVN